MVQRASRHMPSCSQNRQNYPVFFVLNEFPRTAPKSVMTFRYGIPLHGREAVSPSSLIWRGSTGSECGPFNAAVIALAVLPPERWGSGL